MSAKNDSDQITEYTVLDLRAQLALAVEAMDEIIRDIRNSDETPEGAFARVAAEIAKLVPVIDATA